MGTIIFIFAILLAIGNSGNSEKKRQEEARRREEERRLAEQREAERREEERREAEHRERERQVREREQRRKNTPYYYHEGFSEEEFKSIVYRAAKRIRGITGVSVEGLVIYCKVTSVSGKSDWYFKLDFNDFGSFTERCWKSSENWDSSIPDRLKTQICSGVSSLRRS